MPPWLMSLAPGRRKGASPRFELPGLRLGAGDATTIGLGFDQPTAIASEKRLNALLDEFVKRLENG